VWGGSRLKNYRISDYAPLYALIIVVVALATVAVAVVSIIKIVLAAA
jgi:hypothetical protein